MPKQKLQIWSIKLHFPIFIYLDNNFLEIILTFSKSLENNRIKEFLYFIDRMKKICVNVLIASMFVLVGLTNVLCNNKEKDKLEYVETNKMSAYNDLGRTFIYFLIRTHCWSKPKLVHFQFGLTQVELMYLLNNCIKIRILFLLVRFFGLIINQLVFAFEPVLQWYTLGNLRYITVIELIFFELTSQHEMANFHARILQRNTIRYKVIQFSCNAFRLFEKKSKFLLILR